MALQELKENILNFLFNGLIDIDQSLLNLIKNHNKNLKRNGDLSFPSNFDIWKRKVLKSALENDNFALVCSNLVEESNKWKIQIVKISIENDRYLLHLNRTETINYVIHDILENENYGKFKLNYRYKIFYEKNDDHLNNWRICLIAETIKNLVNMCDIQIFDEDNKLDRNLKFINSSFKNQIDDSIYIFCGLVQDSTTKKKTNFTKQKYLELRRNDMQLISMHKYGIRIKNSSYFNDFLDKVGKAAAIIDLLEVKHSSPVIVGDTEKCSKGAAFILYNYARIETLLQAFSENVEKRYNITLPPLSEVNLKELKEEEEWELIFCYILQFPNILNTILSSLQSGNCSTHLLPQFLTGFSAIYSVYYKRIRVLVENRNHLLPGLFARIYLLKCIQRIFQICFQILDIQPVSRM